MITVLYDSLKYHETLSITSGRVLLPAFRRKGSPALSTLLRRLWPEAVLVLLELLVATGVVLVLTDVDERPAAADGVGLEPPIFQVNGSVLVKP